MSRVIVIFRAAFVRVLDKWMESLIVYMSGIKQICLKDIVDVVESRSAQRSSVEYKYQSVEMRVQ